MLLKFREPLEMKPGKKRIGIDYLYGSSGCNSMHMCYTDLTEASTKIGRRNRLMIKDKL